MTIGVLIHDDKSLRGVLLPSMSVIPAQEVYWQSVISLSISSRSRNFGFTNGSLLWSSMIAYALSDLLGYLVWCKITKIIFNQHIIPHRSGYMQMLQNLCKSSPHQNGLRVLQYVVLLDANCQRPTCNVHVLVLCIPGTCVGQYCNT